MALRESCRRPAGRWRWKCEGGDVRKRNVREREKERARGRACMNAIGKEAKGINKLETRKREKKRRMVGVARPDPRPGVSEKVKGEGALGAITETGEASWLGKEQGSDSRNIFFFAMGKGRKEQPSCAELDWETGKEGPRCEIFT
jgi:hypothetical protein